MVSSNEGLSKVYRGPVMRSYVVDVANAPWKPGETEGLRFTCQVLLDGMDGGPEAIRFRFDPTPSVYAHMHLTSQFQLVLGGDMDMPRGMHLRRFDVHYTDYCVPYGPFSVANGHDMLVLHPRRGGLISMADLEARAAINLKGRLFIGSGSEAEWKEAPDSPLRYKSVMRTGGPDVSLIECAAGAAVMLPPPVYGRYEVVLDGAIEVEGRKLEPPGFRYVEGHDLKTPVAAGPDGATIMMLSFDSDATNGGLTGQGIALKAEEAIAQAI
jgi:hypothetical protein